MKNIVITANTLLLFMFFVYMGQLLTAEHLTFTEHYEGNVPYAVLDLLIFVVPILTLKYIVGLER